MDPTHITDLIQMAKAASPWGAGALVVLSLFRLVCELRQPLALAKAVKSLGNRQEQEILVELFRIAHPPKTPSKGESKQLRKGRYHCAP